MIFLIQMVLISCGKAIVDSPQDIVEYVQDESNGVLKTKEIDQIKITLAYRPMDLLLWQEVKDLPIINDSVIKAAELKYQPCDYFLLSISNDGEDFLRSSQYQNPNYLETFSDFSFRIKENITVLADSDTIPLSDAYFANQYGVSKQTQVLLVFPRKNTAKKLTIDISGRLIGSSNQEFDFLRADLDNVPVINRKKFQTAS